MTIEQNIRTTISNLRTEAERLEAVLARLGDNPASAPNSQVRTFDPDSDVPDVTPDVAGDRHQRDWCAFLFWSQLLAFNVRKGRGANRAESAAIAKQSGYVDGRAWNAWGGWTKDATGGRWITETGLNFLDDYAGRLGLQLPADLRDYKAAADDEE